MADKILNAFDVWITAQGVKSRTRLRSVDNISLEGIARLRELILELAVQGKLVSQLSKDEPASEKLKKIASERKKLIADNKLKRPKDLPAIEGDEDSQLPKGWASERFGNIFNVINGRAYKMDEMLQVGTPILRVGNLFTSDEWYYSDLDLEPEKYIDKGDLIYAWSASFGPFIWQGEKVIYHYHIWKLDPFSSESISNRFFLHYLNAITKSIKNSGNGIAMIHMTKERMEKLVVALPPLAEQHRIVAKVDELMALCDALEQQETHHLKSHQLLVETLLGTLTHAADAKEFQHAWNKLYEHFDDLFTTEDSIDQLKQTILQLAVTGKLVPQDQNDEPASKILKQIKEKGPYEIPKNWAWVVLQQISTVGTGATPLTTNADYYNNGDVAWVTSSATNNLFIEESETSITKKALEETNCKVYPKGTLIVAMYGQGKTRGQVSELNIDAATNQACAAIELHLKDLGHRRYVKLFFQKIYLEIRELAEGGAQPNLNLGKVKETLIPFPPLAEQKRIVAKVNELFALCDRLKERIAEAQRVANVMAENV
jgi:type I restriction enzyme S subunit